MNRMLDKGARLDIDFRDEVVDDKRRNTREARVQGVLSAFLCFRTATWQAGKGRRRKWRIPL